MNLVKMIKTADKFSAVLFDIKSYDIQLDDVDFVEFANSAKEMHVVFNGVMCRVTGAIVVQGHLVVICDSWNDGEIFFSTTISGKVNNDMAGKFPEYINEDSLVTQQTIFVNPLRNYIIGDVISV